MPDDDVIQQLAEALSIDPVLAALLLQREIKSFEEAKHFFRPDIRHLHDPFLMQDMEKAIERIETALEKEEKILIYGDYDVDGTTAVALVYSFFSKRTTNISYYIPDRYKEGYGISTQGIDYAAENSYSLIIALDCGIKSVDKIDYANSLGIDFIICDHHLPGGDLPKAIGVLDPKRADCEYPYKELSGCGIGFKLVQAYAEKNGIPFESIACYMDLVAVSIACDIVHITGENRTLAYFGLQKLNSEPCTGIKTLMEIAGKKERVNISDVVFSIGPRINAAGRIADAKHAVALLISDDVLNAGDIGALINGHNAERKGHDQTITDEALSMIKSDAALVAKKSTVVFNERWHKGVIGIVASRLTEKYYRPTIVLTRSNGHVAGSARSVYGFDLYEALSNCSDLLTQYGGHMYAAGLTMPPENVLAFIDRFEEVVGATITDEQLIPEIKIDAEIKLSQINSKFYRVLSQFGPFGPANMTPVFLSKGVRICGQPLLVGSEHLKMFVQQDGSAMFECIAFGQHSWIRDLKQDRPFDICYCIEENVWRDKRTLQLNIKGIRQAAQQ
ncbi:single-stranded-DNA-specific exonuclease RecJ [Mucilaginibacter ginkgonis]|uniref:Single-stranded-DNA-specific exonuclease RecJ n=2 Tax=Mucilaginibacter ginkgonis TaxID=2682091 RepID=A0A6I4HZ87_9SPHI|nr:single-stranded-DNA-specific exonuclease RecJ [Mucilaginibacter ginkgonis]QQL51580.1 single-stranded-DNA-specific exonuclease RecJ [Mucilaginibacter ginkgonis]